MNTPNVRVESEYPLYPTPYSSTLLVASESALREVWTAEKFGHPALGRWKTNTTGDDSERDVNCATCAHQTQPQKLSHRLVVVADNVPTCTELLMLSDRSEGHNRSTYRSPLNQLQT
jgi:hypothetical protein